MALLSLLLGCPAGLASIAANGFFNHRQLYLALDDLRLVLGRVLYVLSLSGIGFAAVLVGVRYSVKSVWRLLVLAPVAASFYLLVSRFRLDYRANLVWSETSVPERTGLALLLVVAVDLTLGKKWGARFLEAVAPRAVATVVGLVLVLSLASWMWFKKLQGALREKPNILMITVDALRADHVSGLGYQRPTTPFLDSLAAGGTLFSQAVSNSNATRATVPSMFTMFHPSVHGMMAGNRSVLSPKFTTLAEILKNEGYFTLAFMPNPVLKRIFNIDQGFDVYEDRILGFGRVERFDSAVPINQKIMNWLDRNAETRFYMYIHYVEPHAPYDPPPAYDRMFYSAGAAARARKLTDQELQAMTRSGEAFELEVPDLNFYLAQYDAEIRYADDQVKYLLGELQQRGILDHTAVFVTADHGEAFLEHGRWLHVNVPPYEEAVHVPIIARLPRGGSVGIRSAAPVHTFDIAATVLDLLGLKPEAAVQARSFLPIVKGMGGQGWKYTLSETPEGSALRNGTWKFLLPQAREGRGGELYNLLEDPKETTNVITENGALAHELEKQLMALAKINAELRKGNIVKERSLGKDIIEQLRALGYMN